MKIYRKSHVTSLGSAHRVRPNLSVKRGRPPAALRALVVAGYLGPLVVARATGVLAYGFLYGFRVVLGDGQSPVRLGSPQGSDPPPQT